MIDAKTVNTSAVLANATQLGVEVLMRMSRKDISGSVQGSPLTRTLASSLVANTIRARVITKATQPSA